MGTRYSKGDQVYDLAREEKRQGVVQYIRNPDSDSPTYVIDEDGEKFERKASDLRKFDNLTIEKGDSTLRLTRHDDGTYDFIEFREGQRVGATHQAFESKQEAKNWANSKQKITMSERESVDIFVDQKPGKSDSLFYAGEEDIAKATVGDKEYYLVEHGKVRVIEIVKNPKETTNVYKGFEFNDLVEKYDLDDEKLNEMERNGDIEVVDYNRFEVLVMEDGETHTTDIIAHTYPEAMSKFKSEVE